MEDKHLPTIVEVLEDVLGGDLSAKRAAMLTASDLVRLGEAVNAFYDAWQPADLEDDDLRLYAGGWVAGNLEAPENLQQLYTTLLYAPSVVMHDPVAEWFEPNRDRVASPPSIRGRNGMEVQGAESQLLRGDGYFAFRDDLDRSQQRLGQVIPILADLAPLITQGIVVPVPQWRLVRERQESILSAVRHDSRDAELGDLIRKAQVPPVRADRIRGMDVTPSGGVIASDELRSVVQNPAYYLDKTLAIADATGSRYTPPASIDARLFEHRLNKLGVELRRKDVDLQVVAALAAADLPFLGALDPKTIVKVRADEPAFADWRAELRTIARTIEQSRFEGARFEQEARAAISDSLLPKAREIEKATSRSSVMRSAAQDQGVTLGIGAASTVGAAFLLGTPIAPAALAGIGISAVSRWAYTSVFGQSPEGTHGVLTTLVRRPFELGAQLRGGG